MIDLLTNAILMGVGMSVMAKERLEELAIQISKDARLSEEEGQKVINELLDQIKKSRKNMDELVIKLINETLTKLDVPTRAEFKDLERRVLELQNLMQDKQAERQ